MVKTLYLFLFLLACFNGCATLAAAQQQDTALYHLKAVEIFGKPTEVYAVGSRVVTLDSSYLATYNSSSLAEALQNRTPLYFKSYGASGLSSVSLRGTNASQTAVLWNGLNIALPTLGQSDFSTLPLSGVGDVAIQHGSAASNYGNGAIGGAILLNSPTYKKSGFGAELQQEAASFGHYFGSGNLRYSTKKFEAGTSIYYRNAENNFPYRDLSRFWTPVLKQHHAAQMQYGATQNLAWHFSPKTSIALHGWYSVADRELQPAMGSADNNAEQLDRNLRLMAEMNHNSRLGQTNVKAAFFNDYLHYTDYSTNSIADVQTYQLQAEQTYTKGEVWSLQSGVNLQHFVAANSGYAGQQEENRASLFALFRYDPFEPLGLSLNIRQTFVEGYNPVPTPTLGFNWRFYKEGPTQFSLKGNTSGSYRVPTLNDRFWIRAGNPNLRPEQGWSFEGGLQHLFKTNSLALESEATLYHMLVNDWIQWSPNISGSWRPVNLQKVRAMGAEFSTRATASLDHLKLSSTIGYTLTSSEQVRAYEGQAEKGKQLMYVPLHKAVFSSDAGYRGWSLMGNLNYTGIRYTNNSESDSLDAFLLLNLALHKRITLGQEAFIISVRSDNVANREYQTMAYRAMPPRSFSLNLLFIIP